jgi:hypothetical protein
MSLDMRLAVEVESNNLDSICEGGVTVLAHDGVRRGEDMVDETRRFIELSVRAHEQLVDPIITLSGPRARALAAMLLEAAEHAYGHEGGEAGS